MTPFSRELNFQLHKRHSKTPQYDLLTRPDILFITIYVILNPIIALDPKINYHFDHPSIVYSRFQPG